MNRSRLLVVVAACALVCGCETLRQEPKVDLVDTTTRTRPIAPVPVRTGPATGGLFHAASYRPAFEDRRARLVGDSLTIQIVENISATQKSSSSIDRNNATNAGVTSIPFIPKSLTDRLAVGATSANSFAGKGGTESANTFTGSITVTVIDVMPNGHLVLAGEKQIGVNANVDVLRFSGTVDPQFVQQGNVVPSSQVANARIESRSRGAQGEVQSIGWLSRAFLSVLPF